MRQRVFGSLPYADACKDQTESNDGVGIFAKARPGKGPFAGIWMYTDSVDGDADQEDEDDNEGDEEEVSEEEEEESEKEEVSEEGSEDEDGDEREDEDDEEKEEVSEEEEEGSEDDGHDSSEESNSSDGMSIFDQARARSVQSAGVGAYSSCDDDDDLFRVATDIEEEEGSEDDRHDSSEESNSSDGMSIFDQARASAGVSAYSSCDDDDDLFRVAKGTKAQHCDQEHVKR